MTAKMLPSIHPEWAARRSVSRVLDYARSFIGVQYVYGTDPGRGDDPIVGFDCSGLISELCRSEGVIRWNQRENSQGFYDRFKARYEIPLKLAKKKKGSLLFFGKSKEDISHIAITEDTGILIEAGGGSSRTFTPDHAAKRNAFVRRRPIDYRGDLVAAVYPWR